MSRRVQLNLTKVSNNCKGRTRGYELRLPCIVSRRRASIRISRRVIREGLMTMDDQTIISVIMAVTDECVNASPFLLQGFDILVFFQCPLFNENFRSKIK